MKRAFIPAALGAAAVLLAITGGTGTYANARGSMDLKYHTKKGTKFDFFHVGD